VSEHWTKPFSNKETLKSKVNTIRKKGPGNLGEVKDPIIFQESMLCTAHEETMSF
jgi:hypothetical protein